MTDPLSTCPDCGAPLPPDSPQALCPACLMRQALASRTIADGDHPAPASPPLTPEELGEKFPGYEILQCLGRGGMGVVYKARQKSLNRIVAIKILAPERGSESRFAERFAREAELLAKLNHPHIVTIHDFGETGGLFYLVMEFVDGVNLRDLLRDGKLEAKQALAIVPPICDALQYAHDKGIVHRDIKPENLLLDREGRIKIADFGIASLMGAAGEIAGTPPYMAPEQTGGDIDHRADIYALGVVLYEMLTGERPDKELIAPSRKVQIDVRLDEMVLRALEQDPERRYQTAGEFKTLVETMKPDHPAKPPEPPVPVRPPGMFRRWWWILLLMIPGGMILGLSAGAVFSYLAPKKYEASAVIEVKTVPGSPLGVGSEFFGSVYAELTSDANLRLVSQQLDLSNRWMLKEHEVPGALKGIITVQNIRGTDLVEIRVRHTNPQDAVDLANVIATTPAAGGPFQTVVHQPATRPKTPVSPNVPLVLAIGAGGGLLLSPVFALVCMLVLHRLFPWRPDGASRGKPAPNGASAGKWALGLFIGAIVGIPLLLGFMGTQEAMVICGLALLLALVLGLMSWRSQSGKFTALASGLGLLLLVAFAFKFLAPLPPQAKNAPGTSRRFNPDPPAFGPVIERVVHEMESGLGDEALRLESGELFSLPKSMTNEWLGETSASLLVGKTGIDFQLIVHKGILRDMNHVDWDHATPTAFWRTMEKGPGMMKPGKSENRWSAYDWTGGEVPATFGFHLASRAQGMLQVLGDTPDGTGLRIRYKLLPGPNGETILHPSFELVRDQATEIARRYYPDFKVTLDGDRFVMQRNLREYDVHNGSKSGDVSAETHKETGPAADGFRLILEPLVEAPVSQAFQADDQQILDRPYWKSYVYHRFDPEMRSGVAMYFDFGPGVDERFRKEMLGLLAEEVKSPDTSAVDGPWGDHFKEGEILRAQQGLDDALVSYRRSLEAAQSEMKQHPQDAAWHAHGQRRIKKSHTRIGDVLCAQGDLAGALENYRAGLAGFEPLVRKEAADEELRNELTALYVKIGDVLEAQGDKAGALAAFRKAQEVDFPDFRTWEESFIQSIGGPYNPTIPFNPEELKQLAANPKSEWEFRRLARLINRAGAEKDCSFRYLLEKPELRKNEEVHLALIAYDYSVNGNPKALDDLLARLAKEKTGSDSSVAATLAFVDEWDRVPNAMNAHFAEADGSGGELWGFCKAWTAYLFPRNSLKYEGKAGEGAPVKLR
jgi:serine/threonine protein kinase/tetratricopeptide (TPR) repeat protein